jgi:hypothetical protein
MYVFRRRRKGRRRRIRIPVLPVRQIGKIPSVPLNLCNFRPVYLPEVLPNISPKRKRSVFHCVYIVRK